MSGSGEDSEPPEPDPPGPGGGGGGGVDAPGPALPPPPGPPPGAPLAEGTPWPPGSASTPMRIARVIEGGVHVGRGATCACHLNHINIAAGTETAKLQCKKRLNMTSDEGRHRIIQWLVEGLAIPRGEGLGRKKHLGKNPRNFVLRPEADLVRDALIRFP